MLFVYKGIDRFGKRVSSTIDAKDINDAKHKLKQQSISYKSIKKKKEFAFWKSFKRLQIPPKKLSLFSRNLSLYLKSGVASVVYAIKLEKSHNTDKRMSVFLNSLEAFLREGNSFYAALEHQRVYDIPEFYKHSVKVAEESGTLEIVLRELSLFLVRQEKIKSRVANALAYPLFILLVSIVMVGFMLRVIVPKITAIFEQLGSSLPTITEVVIKYGEFMQKNGMVVVVSSIGTILLYLYLYKRFARFAFFVDSMLLKIPFFGKIAETTELSKFAYMVSVLVGSGMTFVQAVKLSSNTIKNRVISKVFLDASKEIVKGRKLSSALLQSRYHIESSFIHSLILAEQTSEISSVLKNLSEIYNEENSDKIDILLSLVEPFFILIVGALVGIIVVAMLLPIFSIRIHM